MNHQTSGSNLLLLSITLEVLGLFSRKRGSINSVYLWILVNFQCMLLSADTFPYEDRSRTAKWIRIRIHHTAIYHRRCRTPSQLRISSRNFETILKKTTTDQKYNQNKLFTTKQFRLLIYSVTYIFSQHCQKNHTCCRMANEKNPQNWEGKRGGGYHDHKLIKVHSATSRCPTGETRERVKIKIQKQRWYLKHIKINSGRYSALAINV